MKNEVTFCGHEVYRWIVVFSGAKMIGQFASMSEAKEVYGDSDVRFYYAAAAKNGLGSIGSTVYGDSLSDVMKKLRVSFNNGEKKVVDSCFVHYVILYRYLVDANSIALIKFTTYDRTYFNKELKRMRKSSAHSIVNVSVVSLPIKIFTEKRIEDISTL